jgi:hypothetical protein
MKIYIMKQINHNNYPKAFIYLKPSGVIPGEIGAFALRPFKKGEKIISFREFEDNFLMPINEYEKLNKETKKMVRAFCELTKDFAIIPANINHIKNIYYINHSCYPNVGFDKKDNYIAIRNIRKNDEFLMSYSLLYSYPKFRMKCLCKNKHCRGFITGNDWKDKKLQKRYGSYFISTINNIINKNAHFKDTKKIKK